MIEVQSDYRLGDPAFFLRLFLHQVTTFEETTVEGVTGLGYTIHEPLFANIIPTPLNEAIPHLTISSVATWFRHPSEGIYLAENPGHNFSE